VGTKEDIKEAADTGGSICAIANPLHRGGRSIAIRVARELGLETVGFLMMYTPYREKLARRPDNGRRG